MSAVKANTNGAEVAVTKKIEAGSSSSLEYNTAEQEEKVDREVRQLVRRYTSQSIQHHHESPFENAEGTRLDPLSSQFRVRDWAKSFYELRYSNRETDARVAGIAFKSLNVWGKGSPTDFQSTVGNTILKLPALLGRGNRKIDILRDIDGLLLPGEQLCVLGPPG
ncbi:Multidrug resistance protein, partial [Neodidymelliopsis sp. IMI 364377]